MTIAGQEKPSLDELMHYGVLGMKWGHRKAATGRDIIAARRRLKAEARVYRKESRKLDTATGERKTRIEADLRKRQQNYLNNPDRVIAARMTRGEKAAALLLGSQSGIGLAGAVGSIAGTSALSRRIEFKQDTGAYKIDKSTKVQKRIGYDQMARPLIQVGSGLAAGLLKDVGSKASVAIGTRAASKRAAAKAAGKTRALGSTAAKIKYVKPNFRGVHNITTLK